MLDSCKIPVKTNGEWRRWNDLNANEKDRVCKELFKRVKEEDIGRLYGEMYRLPRFDRNTGLNDAKEFATVLNSCGRYDDAETGLRICKGDMSALEIAEQNRTDHRRHISSALSYVKDNHLVHRRRFIQWFDAGSEIKETVVGIVAGMILTSGDGSSQNMPIIAFVDAEDGIKVSARANRNLVDHGLDLSAVMRTAAEIVGGLGGGHTVAAGATIPPDQKDKFLDIVEDLISAQIV
jgi:RecJ-like exonuclease